MDHILLEYYIFLLSLFSLWIVFLLSLLFKIKRKTVWYRLVLLITLFVGISLVHNFQGFLSAIKILFNF